MATVGYMLQTLNCYHLETKTQEIAMLYRWSLYDKNPQSEQWIIEKRKKQQNLTLHIPTPNSVLTVGVSHSRIKTPLILALLFYLFSSLIVAIFSLF